jgi:signal transduction histidine kinase
VNDILDYQRLRAGQQPPELKGVDLGTQLRDAVAANESLAVEAGVRFDLRLPAERVLTQANPDRVTQLVTNLLANALKHSSRGDTVDIILAPADGAARVVVRDRGPGVPPDFEPQLFQQFAQAQAADGTKRPGTGLGLAICKAIAEQMNGRIGYQPAEGPGSIFWFELPLK